MTIRLMLADDHRMLREGLSRSMTEHGFDAVSYTHLTLPTICSV